jgi:hypothetical protein
MHKTAIANWGQQERESEIEAQHACAQVTQRHRNGMARPESNIVEDAAIFAQRNFTFGAAIEVIEYRLRNSAARDGTEVLDAHNPGRCYRGFGHAGRYGTTGPNGGETEI